MNVGPLMNEPDPQLSAPVNEAPAAPPQGGRLLRQLREASGVHIASLAATLKVPVARLQALEEGRLEDLPDLTFARALASSVCRSLKQDPAPVLAAMPLPTAPVDVRTARGLNAPIESGTELSVMSDRPRLQRRFWALGAVLLVLALLAGAWWWQGQAEPLLPPVSVDNAQPPLAQDNAASANAPVPAAAEAVQPANPSPPPAVAGAPALRLTVSGTTWVQVAGASGALRIERLLQAGETLEAGDDLPLQVVVGRADVAQVWLRGEPLDLTAVTRNQVARFEVR